MSALSRTKSTTLARFWAGFVGAPGAAAPFLLENPTEEIREAILRGRDLALYGATPGFRKARGRLLDLAAYAPKGAARDDMNYLFSSRRYPQRVDNVIGAGDIPAGEFLYFSVAIGGDGGALGFPTGFQLSTTETNLDTPNQTPQGKGFIVRQEGISFNTEAAPDDIEQVVDSGALQFQTQGAQFALRKGPFRFWPGGHGVSGFSQLQGVQSAHHGIADPHAVKNLGRLPRVLKPLQNFNYTHQVPRATRATSGVPWQLGQFVVCSLHLWGEQVDKIPE